MKVRCIKQDLGGDFPLQVHRLHNYLEIGDEFIVYGLAFSKNGSFDIIIFNEQHLIFVPIEVFEIIDASVHKLWVTKATNFGGVMIGPELFMQEDFWENHSEYEEKEREQFKALRPLFEM